MTVFIVTEGNMVMGKSPGLCAGGGQSQLKGPTKKLVHMPEKGGHGGKSAKLGFPCNECTIGLGSVGAMCNCKEWTVPSPKQGFTKKYSLGYQHKMNAAKMSEAGLS